MGSDNGRTPLDFKTAGDIPIVGQPFTIKGWHATVLLTCHCAREPVMIPQGAEVACPGCKRIYSIQVIAITPDGKMNFGIGMKAPASVPMTEVPRG